MPSEEPGSGEHGEQQQDPSQECGKDVPVVVAATPPPPEQAKDPTEDPLLTDENSEFLVVNLSEIRKIMQCPICLGIIRKTRTVMECLHRFCRECIDKSMRLGNNECPACRTHCASRRSLRDDPNFDSLIAGLYEDVDKYEEEEMSLLDEETWKNKQIQANIAETAKRQSEALAKRRTAKATAAAIVRKALRPGGGRSSSRGRTRRRGSRRDSSPLEDGSDEYTERETPVEPRRTSTRKRQRPVSFDSSASVSLDESNDESEEEPEISPGPPPVAEDTVAPPTGNGETMVSWARGAARSQSRHSNAAAGGVRHVKCTRASSLFESLSTAVHPATNELDVQFTLQALPDEGTPSNTLPRLERPFLSCSPKLTIQQLCSYIMSHDLFPVDTEIEILVGHAKKDVEITPEQRERFARGDFEKMKIINLIALDNTATMGDIYNTHWNRYSNLTLLYRRKCPG